MFTKIKNYILENEFKILFLPNKINIVNYIDIDHFDSNKIIIKYDKGLVIINGEELIISKLLQDEILIMGKVNKLEFQ